MQFFFPFSQRTTRAVFETDRCRSLAVIPGYARGQILLRQPPVFVQHELSCIAVHILSSTPGDSKAGGRRPYILSIAVRSDEAGRGGAEIMTFRIARCAHWR